MPYVISWEIDYCPEEGAESDPYAPIAVYPALWDDTDDAVFTLQETLAEVRRAYPTKPIIVRGQGT